MPAIPDMILVIPSILESYLASGMFVFVGAVTEGVWDCICKAGKEDQGRLG